MATLWITPFAAVDVLSGALVVPALVLPPLSNPATAVFTAGAAKSAALPSGTAYVQLEADTACHFALQVETASIAATVASQPLAANTPMVFRLPPGVPVGGWAFSAIARA